MKKFFAPAVIVLSMSLFGCASKGPTVGNAVSYGNASDVDQVSLEFGSTDLQMMAEKMASSLSEFSAENFKDKPFVTLAGVKNKTDEYIDTKSITDTIKTQLIKGRAFRLAVDTSDMQNQTDELQRQNNTGLYKKSTTAKVGQMQAAKYRIEGNLTSIVKKNSSIKDVYYKFTLQMTDVETGEVTWMDEKEIRKSAKR